MASIPDAGDARCAHRGVLHALLRVSVVGGLALAGWLLSSAVSSGIAQAHEDSGLASAFSGVSNVRIALLSSLDATAADPPEEVGSGGLLAAPTTIRSTVAGVLDAAPVPRLPVQPAGIPLLDPVLDPVSELASPDPMTRSRAANHRTTVVPPPAAPVASALPTAGVTALAPVPHTAADAPTESLVCAAGHPVAEPSADLIMSSTLDSSRLDASPLRSDPTAPVQPSSPGTTTAPCPAGSAGGGGIAESGHSEALSDEWAMTGLNPTHCRLCASVDGIMPSTAQRPSSSPD